jgi:hypothetical protein
MAYKFNPFTGKLEEYGPVLTGTGTVSAAADGTAGSPGIAFANDLNTGIYRPGSDQIAISTGGTGRLFVDSSGRVGVGTSSPQQLLHVHNSSAADARIKISNGTTGSGQYDGFELNCGSTGLAGIIQWEQQPIYFYTNNGSAVDPRLAITAAGNVGIGTTSPGSIFDVKPSASASTIRYEVGTLNSDSIRISAGGTVNTYLEYRGYLGHAWFVDATERARIDSSGRLLVGTSSARSAFYSNTGTCELQLEGDGEFSAVRNINDAFGSSVILGKTRSSTNTVVSSGDTLGNLSYQGNDGSKFVEAARIAAVVDGTPGNDDMPGRLVFSTTADGASSPTERMRIDSAGNVGIGTTSPAYRLDVTGGGIGVNTTGGTSASIVFNQTGIGVAEIGIPANENALQFRGYNGATIVERCRIDGSGRLLVGTSTARTDYFNNSLTAMLQVEGTNASGAADRACVSIVNNNNLTLLESPVLILGRSNGSTVNSKTIVSNGTRCGYITFQGADGSDLIDAASIAGEIDGTPGANDMPGRLVFSTTADGASSPTERMRIDSAGTIRFGTTNPFYAYIGAAGDFSNVVNNITCATFQRNSGIGTVLQFKIDSNLPGSISCDTVSTSYNTSSDYRLKENVVSLTGAIDRVNQLQVHRFNFISEPDRTVDGFIAHEAQAVVPECATGIKDEVDAGGNPVYQGIDQSKLVPLLTAALQEAIAEIAVLKDRVAALEGN